MEEKSVTAGWKKLGIGIFAIWALTRTDPIEFKIAVIIGVIAIVGIITQGVLDYRKNLGEPK